jgi:hypothetical protein
MASLAEVPMTKLVAVNLMLETISERPVATLETSNRLDVTTAVVDLDTTIKQVLTTGWWFNTQPDVAVLPDGDGAYQMPSDLLRFYDSSERQQPSPRRLFVRRGDTLFDNRTRTAVGFTDTIYQDWIVSLPFEDLPESARRYTCMRAAIRFAAHGFGAPGVVQFTKEDAKEAYADLKRENIDSQHYSLMNRPDIRYIRGTKRRRGTL